MKRISFLFTTMVFSGLTLAAGTSAPLENSTLPASPQAWAAKMLDPTQNGSAFKDPATFIQWVNAMLNPATSMALAQQAMDPNTAIHMMSGMMNPATLQNYAQFAAPSLIMKWISAALDPDFYNALLRQGMNPNNLTNWASAPTSPQMLNLGTHMLNPSMYGNWMAIPMNPAMYMNQPITGMNPMTLVPWGQAFLPGQTPR